MIIQHDSLAATRKAWLDCNKGKWSGDTSFCGGETRDQTKARTLSGDTSLVPAAERLITSLAHEISTPRRVVEECVAGGWVSVPDALANRPRYMRRVMSVAAEHAPINILVCITSSAGVNAKLLHKRGTVILALVMALARTRPVNLHTCSTLDGRDTAGETIITTHINTSPLDLATACYMLTSQGFARRVIFDIAERVNGYNGSWPRNFNYGRQGLYLDYISSAIHPGAGNQTLVIGPAHLYDPIVNDPLTWIRAQISRFTTTNEEEE